MEKRTRHGVKKKAEFNAENFSLIENGQTSVLMNALDEIYQNGNLAPLEMFFESRAIEQIVQAWSYSGNTSSQSNFAKISGLLAWTLHTISEYPSLLPLGSSLLKTILNNHWDVVYRGLFFNKPFSTNALTTLLKEMALFHHGAYAVDVYNGFDFTQRSLPKIFHPKTKPETRIVDSNQVISEVDRWTSRIIYETYTPRQGLVRFYLALLRGASGNPSARRSMIKERVAVGGWLKSLDTDPEDIVADTICILDELSNDRNVSRKFKLRFFNEWVVSSVTHIFRREDNTNSADVALDFLTSLLTSTKQGIKYADNGWYDYVDHSAIAAEGATQSTLDENDQNVNKEDQKEKENPKLVGIRNYALFDILKALKPWEDARQQTLVVNMLRASPELVRPYMTLALGAWATLNPKMTSFWVSFVGFLCRLVQLPIPNMRTSTEPPSPLTVIESILPQVASRAALSKCLQFESFLVRYLAAQFVYLSLNKMDAVLQFYNEKEWDTLPLTSLFKRRLPELQVFVSSLGALDGSSSRGTLLPTVITCFLAKYAEIFPETFSESHFNLPSSMTSLSWQAGTESSEGGRQLDGLHVIQIHSSLLLQLYLASSADSAAKWYNKPSGSNYSLITHILRLGCTTEYFAVQVSLLVQQLTNLTLLFQDTTKCSPVDPIVYTIRWMRLKLNSDQREGLWKMIDEAIARCMRQPYKYIDAIASLTSVQTASTSATVSPLVAAILEQWHFLDNNCKGPELANCISQILRNMCICGENFGLMQALLNGSEMGRAHSDVVKSCMDVENYLAWDSGSDEFFDFALSAPSKDILARHDLHYKIVSPLELYAARFRTAIDSTCAQHLIRSMFQSNQASLVASKGFYEELLRNSDSQTSHSFFSALYAFKMAAGNDFDLNTSDLKSTAKTLVRENGARWYELLWLLDSSDITMILLSTTEVQLVTQCLELLDVLESEVILKVCKLAKKKNSDVHLLDLALKDCLLRSTLGNSFDNLTLKLYDSGLQKSLRVIISRGKVINRELLQKYIVTEDTSSLVEFAGTVAGFVEDDEDSEYAALFKRACESATTILSEPALKLLSTKFNIMLLSEANVDRILNFYSTVSGPVAVSRAAVDLASQLAQHDKKYVETLTSWLSRCLIWLTKRFSEDTALTQRVRSFVKALDANRSLNLWQNSQTRLVNTMLEASIKWIGTDDFESLRHLVAQTIFSAKKSQIEYTKLMYAILFDESLYLDNVLTLAVWKLFMFDLKAHSTQANMQVLLRRYSGTASAQDAILIHLIQLIEAKTGVSVCDGILSWHHADTDQQLITVIGGGARNISGLANLEVCVKPSMIRTTIQYFGGQVPFDVGLIGGSHHKSKDSLDELLSIMHASDSRISQECLSTSYDPNVLMSFLMSSQELFASNQTVTNTEQSSNQVNIPLLVESEALSFFICCLSSNSSANLKNMARIALQAVLSFLNSSPGDAPSNSHSYKDGLGILISKVLTSSSTQGEIPPAISLIQSHLPAVLIDPSHPVYEAAFQYLLSGPETISTSIPMFMSITLSRSARAPEQILWLLTTVTDSLSDFESVKLYVRLGVFQWAISLRSRFPSRFGKHTGLLIAKAQEIANGSMELIKGIGALAWINMNLKEQDSADIKKLGARFLYSAPKAELDEWTDGTTASLAKNLLY